MATYEEIKKTTDLSKLKILPYKRPGQDAKLSIGDIMNKEK